MGYWWILMDVQTCWFPTLYIIQYNILMNGTLYPKKRSSFRLMFRQIVHGKRGRKLGWSSKVPSLQQTSVQIHISRLWFILFIYIIIHIYIYSVSRIKQKSENSFRTPLNIFPFFFLQIYKKSTFCHLPLGVQCTARVPRWWRAPSLCPNIACNGSGHAPMKTCWRSIPRWGSV